jgi:serine/threonine protein kinase
VVCNRLGDIRDLVIGDFDTAARVGVAKFPSDTVGTAGFMAPEVLNCFGVTCYSYSADSEIFHKFFSMQKGIRILIIVDLLLVLFIFSLFLWHVIV